MKRFALLLLLLCGCRVDPIARAELGYSTSGGMSRDTMPTTTEQSITVVIASPKVGLSFTGQPLAFDVLLGPTLIAPVDGSESGVGIGPELACRLRLEMEGVEPFVYASAGWSYFSSRWGDQGTYWGFPIQVGFGIRIPFGGNKGTAEYRHFHQSNGSQIFGSRRPNRGWDCSSLVVGYEND